MAKANVCEGTESQGPPRLLHGTKVGRIHEVQSKSQMIEFYGKPDESQNTLNWTQLKILLHATVKIHVLEKSAIAGDDVAKILTEVEFVEIVLKTWIRIWIETTVV